MNDSSNPQPSARLERASDEVAYLSDWRVAESIGTTVVRSVANNTGRHPTELPKLSTVVDPDALDHLLNSLGESVAIRFEYAGCDVSLRGDGELVIQ